MASHVEEEPVNNAETVEIPTHSVINADIDEQSDNSDEGWNAHIRLDTNKLFWGLNDEEEDSQDEVEDEVIEAGSDEWKNDGLQVGLMVLAIEIGDDPRDEDWIPDSLRRKHNARLARGKRWKMNWSQNLH